MRPTLLNLESKAEIRADTVLDEFVDRQINEWRHAPGGKASSGFVKAGARQLQVTLGFASDGVAGKDATDVRERLKPLEEMLKAKEAGKTPPRCLFSWGEFTLPVVVEAAEVRLGRCLEAGFPTRASVAIRLNEATEPMRTGLGGFAAKLVAPVSALAGTLNSTAVRVREAVVQARQEAKRQIETVSNEVKEVKQKVEAEVAGVKKEVDQQVGEVKKEIESARQKLSKVEGELKGQAKALEAEVEKAEKAIADAGHEVEHQTEDVKKEVEQGVETVKQEWDQIKKRIVVDITTKKGELETLAGGLTTCINEEITKLMSAVADATDLAVGVKTQLQSKLNSILQDLINYQNQAQCRILAEYDALVNTVIETIDENERERWRNQVEQKWEEARSAKMHLEGQINSYLVQAKNLLKQGATDAAKFDVGVAKQISELKLEISKPPPSTVTFESFFENVGEAKIQSDATELSSVTSQLTKLKDSTDTLVTQTKGYDQMLGDDSLRAKKKQIFAELAPSAKPFGHQLRLAQHVDTFLQNPSA